jgi:hypothetical protein
MRRAREFERKRGVEKLRKGDDQRSDGKRIRIAARWLVSKRSPFGRLARGEEEENVLR